MCSAADMILRCLMYALVYNIVPRDNVKAHYYVKMIFRMIPIP